MSRRMMFSSALGLPSSSWQAMTASSTSSAPVASPMARYRVMTLPGSATRWSNGKVERPTTAGPA